MEPRIQYATTSDGVSIAYGEAGEGKPLIVMPPPGFGHAEMAWTMFANLMQPFASEFHTIWYDVRGSGLSDRDAIDFSVEAMNRDLEAVVERARLDSFALVAWTHGVPIAVTYAAAHPEQLSHLVLCDGWARFSDWGDTAAYRASAALLEMDWLLFTETFGQVIWGYMDGAFGRAFAALMRACTEPEAHRALWKATAGYNREDLLPQVTTPTLVIHSKNNRLFPLAAGRRIAAAIPGARLGLRFERSEESDIVFQTVEGSVFFEASGTLGDCTISGSSTITIGENDGILQIFRDNDNYMGSGSTDPGGTKHYACPDEGSFDGPWGTNQWWNTGPLRPIGEQPGTLSGTYSETNPQGSVTSTWELHAVP